MCASLYLLGMSVRSTSQTWGLLSHSSASSSKLLEIKHGHNKAETIRDYWRLLEIAGDYSRLFEIFGDYSRFLEITRGYWPKKPETVTAWPAPCSLTYWTLTTTTTRPCVRLWVSIGIISINVQVVQTESDTSYMWGAWWLQTGGRMN